MNDIPRRSRMDLWTPAEKAISDALVTVEAVGAHPLLTEAVTLLSQAQSKVADYIEKDERMLQQLKKFYGVSTLEALALAQCVHVERLQAKLPPTRDEQPGHAPRQG